MNTNNEDPRGPGSVGVAARAMESIDTAAPAAMILPPRSGAIAEAATTASPRDPAPRLRGVSTQEGSFASGQETHGRHSEDPVHHGSFAEGQQSKRRTYAGGFAEGQRTAALTPEGAAHRGDFAAGQRWGLDARA
jgi:hypothetical protein